MSKPTKQIAKGKTKIISEFIGNPEECRVLSLSDLTAGNGLKKATIPGKGVLSNRLTCNIFSALNRRDIPTAFLYQDGSDSFVAKKCRMILLEVVTRYIVDEKSSYLKRHPEVKPGTRFGTPIIELYLKTTDKKWKEHTLPVDDPLLVPAGGSTYYVYRPDKPIKEQHPLFAITEREIGLEPGQMQTLLGIAQKAAPILRELWESVGADISDVKEEYGVTIDDEVVMADVIDNDSQRLRYKGKEVSKQGFRDDEPLRLVEENYKLVTRLSEGFK